MIYCKNCWRGGIRSVTSQCLLLQIKKNLDFHETNAHSTTKTVLGGFRCSLELILENETMLLLQLATPYAINQCKVLPDNNVHFLSPWSSFLNPIRNCFSALKMINQHSVHYIAQIYTVTVPRGAEKSLSQYWQEFLFCLNDTRMLNVFQSLWFKQLPAK